MGITLLLNNLHCMFTAVGLPCLLIKEAEEVQESTGSSAGKLRLDDTNDFPVLVGKLPHYCAASGGARLCGL